MNCEEREKMYAERRANFEKRYEEAFGQKIKLTPKKCDCCDEDKVIVYNVYGVKANHL